MEAITLVTLGATIKKIVDTAKFAINREWTRVVTQVVVWTTGVGVLWLASSASLTEHIGIFGSTLGDLDAGSVVLAGLVFSSAASVFADFGKQVDNQNTFQTPPLVPTA